MITISVDEVMLNIKDVHEEQRVGCLTQQMRSFIVVQDEVGNLPEVSLAIERSYLAMDIQNICHDLCNTGDVRK